MDTFLPPIEHPDGFIMKLAYFFTRKQFGKVLTPLKIHSARLPAAFGLFYGKIGKLDKKLTLLTKRFCLSANRSRASTFVCFASISAARSRLNPNSTKPNSTLSTNI